MDPVKTSRPLLSFSHASKFLASIREAGLISAEGKILTYKASEPATLEKRVKEMEDINWKARGFSSLADFIKREVLQPV